ncbi:cytochrome c oxidase, cbb3-type, subunit III [Magnetococcus marinus MC-1]|uniref:Cbb3-type cytochrome c oxidase subunit n=1 Tax=Magnetococcus marinus (strain ATCC BAA-1437 / JCM 17883 / MC-1) TaxID=156889 RepID=A0LA62_MAGMM|nr:cytochrome-c oxidase, cbb3-type subunit III [Magnetococcus marinus]ABK44855.1 cytochrome c oxidase, cbb3-type, subunit III [Magnetococcus marinus MC-1]
MSEENKSVSTTGHQWDDEEGYPLQELNNPLPTWWLYTFYFTIALSIVWWILYPAWPMSESATRGTLGWTMHTQLREELAAAKQGRAVYEEQIDSMSLNDIVKDSGLKAYAESAGKAIFGDNCRPCHGQAGQNNTPGFPVLNDDDWIYGGKLANISETINNGRGGIMPIHLESAGGSFSEAQVNSLVDYVMSLSGMDHDAAAAAKGKALYNGDASCYTCHGNDAKGSLKGKADGEEIDDSVGAPNLTDAIWLYGSSRDVIYKTIAYGRNGKMPAWGEGFQGFGKQLTPLDIKKLAIYVHGLGGGQ